MGRPTRQHFSPEDIAHMRALFFDPVRPMSARSVAQLYRCSESVVHRAANGTLKPTPTPPVNDVPRPDVPHQIGTDAPTPENDPVGRFTVAPRPKLTVSEKLLRSRLTTKTAITRELLYAGILARLWPAYLTEPHVKQKNMPALLCVESPAGLLVWRLSMEELDGFKEYLKYRPNPGTPAEDKIPALHTLAFDGGWEPPQPHIVPTPVGEDASGRKFASELQLEAALRAVYDHACHHPSCQRSNTPHECSCGLSAALEQARQMLAS